MTRRELSDDGATWNIPGSRTKNGRAHTVPLSPLVRELIASVKAKPDNPFIFTTTGTTPVSGWADEGSPRRGDARRRAQEGHAAIPPWTLHDLRRTFVTGVVELHVPPHVVELVVNQALGLASPAPTTAPSCFPNARRRSNAGRRTCKASWCHGRTARGAKAEAEVMDARCNLHSIFEFSTVRLT